MRPARPHRPRSLRTRLVRLLLTRLALGLTIAAGGTFAIVHSVLLDHVDQQLNDTATLAEAYVSSSPGALPPFQGGGSSTAPWQGMAAHGDLPQFLELRRADGSVAGLVGVGPPLPAVLAVGPPGSGPEGDGALFSVVDARDASGHSTQYRVRSSRLPDDRGYLVLASSDQEVTDTMTSLGQVEATTWLFALILVGLLANRRIRRELEPLERMGEQAGAIGAGQLDRRIETADDLSEVGRVGASLNLMLARLEQAFNERADSQDRLRRFVADASHELRTPLASIRGYAELFRRGAAARPQDLALAMSRIESESTRMGVLVDELLLLARLDSGRPLERRPVDLAALARDAARDSMAADERWPVTVSAPGQDPQAPGAVVLGDADRLRQALANLLANVRAHTPPGTEAAVTVRSTPDGVAVEVEDAGPGLTAQQRDRVFERFFRADASRRRDEGAAGGGRSGTGLGLAIVASIAEAHGGGASVRPGPLGGCVFTLLLPPDGAPPGARAPECDDSVTASTGVSQPGHSAGPGRAGELLPGVAGAGRHQGAARPGDESRRASDVIERICTFAIRRRRIVYLFWLIALVVGGWASSGLADHLDKSFAMPGQPGYVANTAILAQYGNGGLTAPLVPVVRTPAGVPAKDPRVQGALAALATVPGVRVADYADTGNAGFLGADGRTTYALVFTGGTGGIGDTGIQDRASAEIRQRLTAALPAGSIVDVTGEQPLQNAGAGGGAGIRNEILLGALGALAVLLFVFASLLALVPLLVAAVSVTTAFLAILGLTAVTPVSMIVQYLVGLIGLGVAIDYSLLLVTRWREESAAGYDNETAIRRAMDTAGRAVAFSGVTVALGLLALVILPVPFLRSIGYGGMIIPLVSVLVTLTLVPALLSGIGRRLDWPRIRHEGTASRGWTAWAGLVTRRRWIAAAAALAVLVVLALNATGMKIGDASSDALAQSGPAHDGIVRLEQAGIPSGVITPIEVLVPAATPAGTAAAASARVSGIDFAAAPAGPAWQRPDSALAVAVPRAEGTSSAGEATTRAVRSALASAAPTALVGGMGAAEVDTLHAIYGNFPLMLVVLAILTFVLLARAFRSLLLPLKAVLLNLLSLAAVYGALVLIWQRGYGSDAIWGIPATGAITSWVPLMVFAFLYGLSMDYEVFILSRMREEYDATGSTTTAVVTGIGRTGRLVTSAALILFLAMAALASAPDTDLKIFATALGIGILLDATVVRALLVPALISLFGRWNWWMPAWCAKVLRVESSPPRPEPVAAVRPDPAPAGSGSAHGE